MVDDDDVKESMFSKANVVALGHAQERKKGERTGKETLTAFVTEKKPESELEESDKVPSEVNGEKTDVIEVGRLEIEDDYPVSPGKVETETKDINTNKRHRPFPQGSSIGHKNITAGTAGRIMFEREEKQVAGEKVVYPKPVGTSNNHVVANENQGKIGDSILQPGPYDGGKEVDSKYRVGGLAGYVELKDKGNKVDFAWYSLEEDRIANSFVLGMGVPTEAGTVEKGDMAYKGNTRTTSYREGEVLSTDATVRVKFSDGLKEFEDQIITESISKGGDSGSTIFNKRGQDIGTLFAGSSKVSVVNKIQNILNETPLYLNPEDVYSDK